MKWLKHERSRLILTLELAVVLPAAALVILSALHLKGIQRDRAVEAAIQRDFSQMLAISEKHFNREAYSLADDARADFPGQDRVCEGTLEKILAEHPYVAHVFMFSPQRGLQFASQPGRMNNPDFRAESESLRKMFDGWLSMDFDDFSSKLGKLEKKGT